MTASECAADDDQDQICAFRVFLRRPRLRPLARSGFARHARTARASPENPARNENIFKPAIYIYIYACLYPEMNMGDISKELFKKIVVESASNRFN